jgi:hypothetical protein
VSIFSKNLIKSMSKSSTSHELVDKIGETALDMVLDDGVMKDIPIIGTAISLFKAGDNIKAFLFAKKILTFLQELETLSIKEREDFFSKNISSAKEEEKLSETLLLSIDSSERIDSCRFLGRTVRLYIAGEINKRYFDLYCIAAKRMNDYLIVQLKQFYDKDNCYGVEFHAMHDLASLGLLDIKVKNQIIKETGDMLQSSERNELGKWFYSHIIKAEFA